MSYPINQKINPVVNPSMQASNGLSVEQLQAIDAQRIKQGINNNVTVDKVKEHNNPLLMAGVFIPAAILTRLGINKFAKANEGLYEDSLVGKIGKFGEKIGQNKIFNNNVTMAAQKYYAQAKSFVNNNIIKNVDILNSFFNKKTIPENPMVRTQYGNIIAELASPATHAFKTYVGEGPERDLNKIIELGFKTPTGEADVAAFEKLIADPYGHESKILEICEKNRNKIVPFENKEIFKIPFTKKHLSEYFPKLKKWFNPNTTMGEFANKLKAAMGKETSIQKTLLGKRLPRISLKFIEGMTNAGTGGGGLMPALMGAFFISDAIIRAVKAPKENGEKRKVFAENMIYGLGFYLTMPLALKIMHGFGGLKYLGVSKERVEKFRAEKAKFDEKASSGGFKIEAEYNKAQKEVRNLLKPEYKGNGLVRFVKSVVYWPIKKAAKILTVGIERFAPFNPKGLKTTLGSLTSLEGLKQIFKNEKGFWARNIAGYPIRFLIIIAGLGPFLGKFFAKGSHAVFGRPSKSVLDHESESEKKPQQQIQQQTPQMAPVAEVPNNNQAQMMPTNQGGNLMGQNMNQKTMVSNPVNNDPTKNLVNMYSNKPASREMIATDKPARTYTYIPSAEGVKVEKDNDEDAKINALLDKSYKAEKAASKFGH